MDALKKMVSSQISQARKDVVDEKTLATARKIVTDVRERGETALREHAERFGDVEPGRPLVFGRAELEASRNSLAIEDRQLLERTASRIERFALAQKESVQAVELEIPGGACGQVIAPVERAGCYAPGGRFPLPSSVLMTAVTARAAGVKEVWVASPRPGAVTLAAASIAGADALISAGGAQAIAALAFGAGAIPRCDVVVGPGNRYVTAAKKIIFGSAGIDMLAGPSELLVVADETADPKIVAADLVAQAEHDPDARPMLLAIGEAILDEVNRNIELELRDLAKSENARLALSNGFAAAVGDIGSAASLCNAIAPEHLELHIKNAAAEAHRFINYGALFIGSQTAEVLGDYGAGPNHTLPTGGGARFKGGLSVFDFLRIRTWLRIDDASQAGELIRDAKRLAELEGLQGHVRAADIRILP